MKWATLQESAVVNQSIDINVRTNNVEHETFAHLIKRYAQHVKACFAHRSVRAQIFNF